MKNKKTNPLSRQVGTSPLTGRLNSKSGQIAIVVLLVSAVVLTLGLSASRKSINDLKVDTDQESLKDVFNAAESGINNYINNASKDYTGSSGSNAKVEVVNIGNDISLSSDGLVQPGLSQLFWLVDHNSNGGIGINYYRGSLSLSSTNTYGALKVDYFYIEGGSYKVDRFTCKYPDFVTTNPSGEDIVYNFTNCPPVLNNSVGRDPLLVMVTPIGVATELTLTGSSSFPLQGEELTSVGSVDSGVKTQVKVKNIYEVPSFLTEPIMARKIIKGL